MILFLCTNEYSCPCQVAAALSACSSPITTPRVTPIPIASARQMDDESCINALFNASNSNDGILLKEGKKRMAKSE